MKSLVIMITVLLGLNATAASYLECDPKFTKKFIEEVAAGEREYPNKAKYEFSEDGREWHFVVNNKMKKASAKEVKKKDLHAWDVTTWLSRSARVGKRHRFILSDDEADCDGGALGKLEVKNIGGFAGGVVVEKMLCLCGVD